MSSFLKGKFLSFHTRTVFLTWHLLDGPLLPFEKDLALESKSHTLADPPKHNSLDPHPFHLPLSSTCFRTLIDISLPIFIPFRSSYTWTFRPLFACPSCCISLMYFPPFVFHYHRIFPTITLPMSYFGYVVSLMSHSFQLWMYTAYLCFN